MEMKKCVSDEDGKCNKAASEECDEICSMISIACQEDETANLKPCAEEQNSGESSDEEGSEKGRYKYKVYRK